MAVMWGTLNEKPRPRCRGGGDRFKMSRHCRVELQTPVLTREVHLPTELGGSERGSRSPAERHS